MPQFDKPFTVHVDASDAAIGAVLTQEVNKMDMPVGYYSKRLNETEARWSIYERELYAIVQALGEWWCYLVNRHTIVYSDHQPLQYFMSQPKLLAKQQRWLDFLADFSIDVQYRPGKQNILPDALSRQPAPPTAARPCSDAGLTSMILGLSWLTKVHLGQQLDVTLGPYLEKAKFSDNEFVVRQVHGLSLLYRRPKPDIYQLVTPDGQGLRRLLLEEAHCTPLASHMGTRCKTQHRAVYVNTQAMSRGLNILKSTS